MSVMSNYFIDMSHLIIVFCIALQTELRNQMNSSSKRKKTKTSYQALNCQKSLYRNGWSRILLHMAVIVVVKVTKDCLPELDDLA